MSDNKKDKTAFERSKALKDAFPSVEDSETRLLLWQLDSGIAGVEELSGDDAQKVLPHLVKPLDDLHPSYFAAQKIIYNHLKQEEPYIDDGNLKKFIDIGADKVIAHYEEYKEVGAESQILHALSDFLDKEVNQAERYLKVNQNDKGVDPQFVQYSYIEATHLLFDAVVDRAREKGYDTFANGIEAGYLRDDQPAPEKPGIDI